VTKNSALCGEYDLKRDMEKFDVSRHICTYKPVFASYHRRIQRLES
jgi:hypothetical protein